MTATLTTPPPAAGTELAFVFPASAPAPLSPPLCGEAHDQVLRIMAQAGFPPSDVKTALAERPYDYTASTYYLLLDQQKTVPKNISCAAV